MKIGKAILLLSVAWLVLITAAHGLLNLHWLEQQKAGAAQQTFAVGFLPVTCHLTCPVTDFINKNMAGENFFRPLRFSGFPELKEMFLGRPLEMPATFILAPMVIALRAQGVKIKIVYLGHRDGSAVVVHKDSRIFTTTDLRGKTVAVPGRYANQRMIIYRELKKVGMTLNDIKLIEMPPPDMPAALLSHAVDAITSAWARPSWMVMAARSGRPRMSGPALSPACWWCMRRRSAIIAPKSSAWSTALPPVASGWIKAWRTAWTPPSSWPRTTTTRIRACSAMCSANRPIASPTAA